MAEFAGEGSVYLIDLRNSKPPHYWVVLEEPDDDERFLACSWTDAANYAENADLWMVGTKITDSFDLTKESVVQVRYSRVADQGWLDKFGAQYQGTAYGEVLRRARCNLCWIEEQLVPQVMRRFLVVKHEWCHDCDDLQPHTHI